MKQVLARRNPLGEYGADNVYWRNPRSAKEERWGLEDLGFSDEPDVIPLTREEQQKRAALPEEEQEMFDIWVRIMWRSKNHGPS